MPKPDRAAAARAAADRMRVDGHDEATIDACIKRRMLTFKARALLDPLDSPRRTTPTPTTADLWRSWAMHMRTQGAAE